MAIVAGDVACHVVEVIALLSADGAMVVVMRPWGKKEQFAVGTGIKSFSSGLGQWSESVFQQDNNRVPMIKCGPHDSFLARTDAGRDEHGTLSGQCQIMLAIAIDVFLGEAA